MTNTPEKFGIQQLQPASKLLSSPQERLPSGVALVDQFLEGGLDQTQLIEWGLPPGRFGRDMIVKFLAQNTLRKHPKLVLWAYDRDLQVYPPAWKARGVNLNHIFFAKTKKPVTELKPVFFHPVFQWIILDAPATITKDELAFISSKARQEKKTVWLLRNYFLSPKNGNIWAQTRINCWADPIKKKYYFKRLRGSRPTTLSFPF